MIRQAIFKVVTGTDLTEDEMAEVMSEIGQGRATAAQIGSLLTGLRMKGECVDEIVGAARVLRERRLAVEAPFEGCRIVDTCGTGGDETGTFNVSTLAALTAAGCGLYVAKHGARSVSSRCGSADVIEALGVNLDLTPEASAECLRRAGIVFLFAPKLHPAMGHAVGPRKEVGLRSIFNLLGPLVNPAGASVQVLGVYAPELTGLLAEALRRLGCRSAYVVHGEDGYDEFSITGPTRAARLRDGKIETFTLTPESVGLKRGRPEDIVGGDAPENARLAMAVLEGEPGPKRDMVLLNAAAAFEASGLAADLKEGVRLAAESIDSGRALGALRKLIETSHELATLSKAVGE